MTDAEIHEDLVAAQRCVNEVANAITAVRKRLEQHPPNASESKLRMYQKNVFVVALDFGWYLCRSIHHTAGIPRHSPPINPTLAMILPVRPYLELSSRLLWASEVPDGFKLMCYAQESGDQKLAQRNIELLGPTAASQRRVTEPLTFPEAATAKRKMPRTMEKVIKEIHDGRRLGGREIAAIEDERNYQMIFPRHHQLLHAHPLLIGRMMGSLTDLTPMRASIHQVDMCFASFWLFSAIANTCGWPDRRDALLVLGLLNRVDLFPGLPKQAPQTPGLRHSEAH